MKTRKPFLDSVLGIRQDYQITKDKERVVLTIIREHLQNADAFGAKHLEIFSAKIKKKYYIVIPHDGTPFDSEEDICNSLYPSTSVGTGGMQGMGGKLASLLSCHRNKDCEHYIFSFNEENEYCYRLKLEGQYAKVDSCPDMIATMKSMLVGCQFTPKVVYMSRYQPIEIHRRSFQDIKSLNQIGDFVPSVFEKKDAIKLIYTHGGIVSSSEEENNEEDYCNLGQLHNQKLNGEYKNIEAISNSQFVDMFCPKDCRFSFPFKNFLTSLTNGQGYGILSGSIDIEVYPGVFRHRHGTNSNGLIPLNKTKADHKCVVPKYTTSLVLDCFEDPQASRRLSSDPVILGNMLDSIGIRLGLSIRDRLQEFNDLENFPEFSEIYEESKNIVAKTARMPFVRIRYRITSFSVVSNKPRSEEDFEKCEKLDESEIRHILGSLDPFFMIQNKFQLQKIMRDLASEIEEKFRNELNDLRTVIKKYYPWSMDDLTDLPNDDYQKLGSVRFIPNDNKRMSAGDSSIGRFVFATGDNKNLSVPPETSIDYDSLKDQGVVLNHDIGEEWRLSFSPYRVRENKLSPWRDAKPEEYVEYAGKNSDLHLPHSRAVVRVGGRLYNLIPRIINLPKVRECKSKSRTELPPADGADGADGEKFTKDKYVDFGNDPNFYVVHEGNITILNKGNEKIVTLFKNIPHFNGLQLKLWQDIKDRAVEIDFILSQLTFRPKDNSSELSDDRWGVDESTRGRNYLLNKMISPLFDNPKIEKLIDEINKFSS